MNVPAVTVVVATWRLGGFDVFLSALARQTFNDFEVVIADALHRWRAPHVARDLAAFPFPIVHVPVDRSIFPLTCAARTRNTALRHARGRITVFLADYACPPPNFLAAHVEAHEAHAGGRVIAQAPYRLLRLRPEAWALVETTRADFDIWTMIACARDGMFSWSAFDPAIPPGSLAPYIDPSGIASAQPCPLLDPLAEPGMWSAHWKADSVPIDALRAVNGVDEAYDGFHGFDDTDLAVRLIVAGAHTVRVPIEVPVLDAHPVMPRPLEDAARDNAPRLDTARLAAAAGHVRCRRGIEYLPGPDEWLPLPSGDISRAWHTDALENT